MLSQHTFLKSLLLICNVLNYKLTRSSRSDLKITLQNFAGSLWCISCIRERSLKIIIRVSYCPGLVLSQGAFIQNSSTVQEWLSVNPEIWTHNLPVKVEQPNSCCFTSVLTDSNHGVWVKTCRWFSKEFQSFQFLYKSLPWPRKTKVSIVDEQNKLLKALYVSLSSTVFSGHVFMKVQMISVFFVWSYE